jgi:NADPH:quinone reductase-like Zn-dependent oxidoreductase
VRSLGADEVLDYKTPEGAHLESPSGRRYDGVVHCVDGISWSTLEPVLSDKGKVHYIRNVNTRHGSEMRSKPIVFDLKNETCSLRSGTGSVEGKKDTRCFSTVSRLS